MIPLRQVFNEPPLSYVQLASLPGGHAPSLSRKEWARDYRQIRQDKMHVVSEPSQAEIDSIFGPEDDLDRRLISKRIFPPNVVEEVLQSEGDTVRAFYSHISHFTMLAFQGILTQRSETGPLGPTSSPQTVDWTYGLGNDCVVLGELKRHGIINPRRWIGTEAADSIRINLSKELRGLVNIATAFLPRKYT